MMKVMEIRQMRLRLQAASFTKKEDIIPLATTKKSKLTLENAEESYK